MTAAPSLEMWRDAEALRQRLRAGLVIPAHPLAQEIIRLAGTPLAAPSANNTSPPLEPRAWNAT